jgi:2-polyprenyl-6-hydroxyphenyl methylase/3-demethylubiquinone-9 3-methyltransferase
MTLTDNVHLHEIHKFGSQAERWWDPQGALKTLHAINPLRIQYIERFVRLSGQRIVDVGCGGGLLTEALAQRGATMLGIDLSADLIDIAELHSLETGIQADYQILSAEALAQQQAASFDHVVCMEMLEHVPEAGSVIKACARLVKPGGMVFFSTLNRQPKAYLLAIVAAEYLLQLLPKGTHDYKTFIKPSELSQSARQAGLALQDMIGIRYNPLSQDFSLTDDISVNYIAVFQRIGT